MTALDSERTGLLLAVLEDPYDDGARLVYADWLEDAGEADRAEFVRCQVGEDWKVDGGTKSGTEVKIRFFKGLEQVDAVIGFRRGFVEEVTLPLAAFERHAKAIFSAHPVTRVTLSDREPAKGSIHYFWFGDYRPQGPRSSGCYLPDPLIEAMLAAGYWFDYEHDTSSLHTCRAAIEALSTACVAWGRSLVDPKLPPLEGV